MSVKRKTSTATVGGARLLSPSRYLTAVTEDTPTAYWRLGETALESIVASDLTGNGHYGTYQGTVTQGATGLLVGDSNKAMALAGSGRMEVASGAWMNSLTDFTVEALIKPTGVTGTQTVMSRFNSSSGAAQYTFRLDANKLSLYVWHTSFQVSTSTSTLTAGTTYHVAGRLSSGTIRVFINGTADGTAGSVSTPDSPTVNICVGSNATGLEPFTGTIDEAAFYASALSDTRIAAHAAAAF